MVQQPVTYDLGQLAGRAGAIPPAGEDPRVRGLAAVEGLFATTPFISLFSIPDPQKPDEPIEAELPSYLSWLKQIPGLELIQGVQVNEGPLRFVIEVEEDSGRLLARNRVGRSVATVHIRWTPIPWSYGANPHSLPPQTIFSPLWPQRFEMLDGQFRFRGSGGSGINGFGAGRTFPQFPDGLAVNIGAVIDILEGVGELAGFTGTLVVNGRIVPPKQLDLNILCRLLDPSGSLLTREPLPSLAEREFPDPSSTFMMFLGEADPEHAATLERRSDGTVVGVHLHERLRLVHLDADLLAGKGLRSLVERGPVVGTARSTLRIPFSSGEIPLPIQSEGVRFSFFGGGGRGDPESTIDAELVEGRGFPFEVAGAPGPLLRGGAFGPIRGGCGQFRGARGMLSVNMLLGVFPRTSSNLYVLRFFDRAGKWRVPGSGGA